MCKQKTSTIQTTYKTHIFKLATKKFDNRSNEITYTFMIWTLYHVINEYFFLLLCMCTHWIHISTYIRDKSCNYYKIRHSLENGGH